MGLGRQQDLIQGPRGQFTEALRYLSSGQDRAVFSGPIPTGIPRGHRLPGRTGHARWLSRSPTASPLLLFYGRRKPRSVIKWLPTTLGQHVAIPHVPFEYAGAGTQRIRLLFLPPNCTSLCLGHWHTPSSACDCQGIFQWCPQRLLRRDRLPSSYGTDLPIRQHLSVNKRRYRKQDQKVLFLGIPNCLCC